jgi:hypothetical protein
MISKRISSPMILLLWFFDHKLNFKSIFESWEIRVLSKLIERAITIYRRRSRKQELALTKGIHECYSNSSVDMKFMSIFMAQSFLTLYTTPFIILRSQRWWQDITQMTLTRLLFGKQANTQSSTWKLLPFVILFSFRVPFLSRDHFIIFQIWRSKKLCERKMSENYREHRYFSLAWTSASKESKTRLMSWSLEPENENFTLKM